jgi:hypothetical protein
VGFSQGHSKETACGNYKLKTAINEFLQKFSVAEVKSTFIAGNKEQKYLEASPNLMLE